VNDALGHCSFIDHMFVSDSVRQDITCRVIFELGANVSYHMPLIYSLQFANTISVSKLNATRFKNRYHLWRWDKANLGYFYSCSYQSLSDITVISVGLVVVLSLTCRVLIYTMNLSYLHC